MPSVSNNIEMSSNVASLMVPSTSSSITLNPDLKKMWIVGRHPVLCDLHIEGAHVSRKHFVVYYELGKFYVRDLQSANGTYVGDQRVSMTNGLLLKSETEIFAGAQVISEGVTVRFISQDNSDSDDDIQIIYPLPQPSSAASLLTLPPRAREEDPVSPGMPKAVKEQEPVFIILDGPPSGEKNPGKQNVEDAAANKPDDIIDLISPQKIETKSCHQQNSVEVETALDVPPGEPPELDKTHLQRRLFIDDGPNSSDNCINEDMDGSDSEIDTKPSLLNFSMSGDDVITIADDEDEWHEITNCSQRVFEISDDEENDDAPYDILFDEENEEPDAIEEKNDLDEADMESSHGISKLSCFKCSPPSSTVSSDSSELFPLPTTSSCSEKNRNCSNIEEMEYPPKLIGLPPLLNSLSPPMIKTDNTPFSWEKKIAPTVSSVSDPQPLCDPSKIVKLSHASLHSPPPSPTSSIYNLSSQSPGRLIIDENFQETNLMDSQVEKNFLSTSQTSFQSQTILEPGSWQKPISKQFSEISHEVITLSKMLTSYRLKSQKPLIQAVPSCHTDGADEPMTLTQDIRHFLEDKVPKTSKFTCSDIEEASTTDSQMLMDCTHVEEQLRSPVLPSIASPKSAKACNSGQEKTSSILPSEQLSSADTDDQISLTQSIREFLSDNEPVRTSSSFVQQKDNSTLKDAPNIEQLRREVTTRSSAPSSLVPASPVGTLNFYGPQNANSPAVGSRLSQAPVPTPSSLSKAKNLVPKGVISLPTTRSPIGRSICVLPGPGPLPVAVRGKRAKRSSSTSTHSTGKKRVKKNDDESSFSLTPRTRTTIKTKRKEKLREIALASKSFPTDVIMKPPAPCKVKTATKSRNELLWGTTSNRTPVDDLIVGDENVTPVAVGPETIKIFGGNAKSDQLNKPNLANLSAKEAKPSDTHNKTGKKSVSFDMTLTKNVYEIPPENTMRPLKVADKIISPQEHYQHTLCTVVSWNAKWLDESLKMRRSVEPQQISKISPGHIRSSIPSGPRYCDLFTRLLTIELWTDVARRWKLVNSIANRFSIAVDRVTGPNSVGLFTVQCHAIVPEDCVKKSDLVIMSLQKPNPSEITIFLCLVHLCTATMSYQINEVHPDLRQGAQPGRSLVRMFLMTKKWNTEIRPNQIGQLKVVHSIERHLRFFQAVGSLVMSPLALLVRCPRKKINLPLPKRPNLILTKDLSVEQNKVLQRLLEGCCSPGPLLAVLAGPAGCGKSLILFMLLSQLFRPPLSRAPRIVFCCPTSAALDTLFTNFQNYNNDKNISTVRFDASNSSMFNEAQLLNSDIIFSTVVDTGDDALKNSLNKSARRLIVIVDEAMECQEPESLVPLMLPTSHFILAGDPRAIQTRVFCERARTFGLKRSLFWRILQDCGTQENAVLRLNTQYRMHPNISRVAGLFRNESKQEPVCDAINLSQTRLSPLEPCITILISKDCPLDEPTIISTIVETIGSVASSLNTIVIAPNRTLLSTLNNQLQDINEKPKVLSVEGTKKLQGREMDVIVLAATPNMEAPEVFVALTRARFSTIVVMTELESTGDTMERLLQAMYGHVLVLSASTTPAAIRSIILL